MTKTSAPGEPLSDIGLYSLRFALVFAVLGTGCGIYAGVRRQGEWTQVAERAVWIVLAFITTWTTRLIMNFRLFVSEAII